MLVPIGCLRTATHINPMKLAYVGLVNMPRFRIQASNVSHIGTS